MNSWSLPECHRSRPCANFYRWLILIAFLLLVQCGLFYPRSVADGALFITEKEMTGEFQGRRLVFNARDSLVAGADVRRSCSIEPSGDRLRCVEKIHYDGTRDGSEEERTFTIGFRYLSEKAVELSYDEPGSPFGFSFFRGGEVNGGGLRLFGGTRIPLSEIPVGMEFLLLREDYTPTGSVPERSARYYEKRIFSYFGFVYGYAETRWERDA